MKITIPLPWEKAAPLKIIGQIPAHPGFTPQVHAAITSKESTVSFLSAVGKDFKAVFTWLGSTKGQTVIKTGEAVITTIEPGLAGIVGLVDSWVEKVIATETLAAAAGQQEGSGLTKAAAVINAIAPQVELLFPAATAAQIAAANTAIVAFLNAFETPASTTPTV